MGHPALDHRAMDSKIFIEHYQIGIGTFCERAFSVTNLQSFGWVESGHLDGFLQRDSDELNHVPDAVDHAAGAACQGFAIGGDADAVSDHGGEGSEGVRFAFAEAGATGGVRDEPDTGGAFRMVEGAHEVRPCGRLAPR